MEKVRLKFVDELKGLSILFHVDNIWVCNECSIYLCNNILPLCLCSFRTGVLF